MQSDTPTQSMDFADQLDAILSSDNCPERYCSLMELFLAADCEGRELIRDLDLNLKQADRLELHRLLSGELDPELARRMLKARLIEYAVSPDQPDARDDLMWLSLALHMMERAGIDVAACVAQVAAASTAEKAEVLLQFHARNPCDRRLKDFAWKEHKLGKGRHTYSSTFYNISFQIHPGS